MEYDLTSIQEQSEGAAYDAQMMNDKIYEIQGILEDKDEELDELRAERDELKAELDELKASAE